MHWSSGIWYGVNSGGRIEKRIPVFALKESEMGERLALSITTIDSDQLPGWLETLVSIITAPVDLLLIVAGSAGATVYESVSDMELDLEVMTGRALRDALTGNEKIGAVNKVYEKASKWGAREEQYEVRGGGMTVKYSIRRVLVPKNSKYAVKVHNVSFADSGDYYNGEVWLNARAAANFGEGDIAATFCCIPARGIINLGDGSLMQGTNCSKRFLHWSH